MLMLCNDWDIAHLKMTWIFGDLSVLLVLQLHIYHAQMLVLRHCRLPHKGHALSFAQLNEALIPIDLFPLYFLPSVVAEDVEAQKNCGE